MATIYKKGRDKKKRHAPWYISTILTTPENAGRVKVSPTSRGQSNLQPS